MGRELLARVALRHRDLAADHRARSRRASDDEAAADGVETVGHSLQAGAVGRPRGVEPTTVVVHLERQDAVGLRQRDHRAARIRVLHDVVQCLQHAEVDRGFDGGGYRPSSPGWTVTGTAALRACASTAGKSPLSASSGG